MQICLNGMCANLDGTAKRGHAVLRVGHLVAAVGNGLRELTTANRTGSVLAVDATGSLQGCRERGNWGRGAKISHTDLQGFGSAMTTQDIHPRTGTGNEIRGPNRAYRATSQACHGTPTVASTLWKPC